MPDPTEPLEPRSRPWIWVVYVFLFGVSVPWYLPAGGPLRLWLGLPHWVVISLAAYLAVAVFTSWVVARYWSVPADITRPATEPTAGAAPESRDAGDRGHPLLRAPAQASKPATNATNAVTHATGPAAGPAPEPRDAGRRGRPVPRTPAQATDPAAERNDTEGGA